jgi:hypothetical protein
MEGHRDISSAEARHLDWVKERSEKDLAVAEARAEAARRELDETLAMLVDVGVSEVSIAQHLRVPRDWVRARIKRARRYPFTDSAAGPS